MRFLIMLLAAAVRYDDALNGAEAAPAYEATIASSPIPMTPAGGAADYAAGSTPKSSPRAILMAWLALLALLIVAHVLTISVQK